MASADTIKEINNTGFLKLVHYRWLQLIAETKNIEPLKDSATLKTIASLVSDVLKDVPNLETLMLNDKMVKGDKK